LRPAGCNGATRSAAALGQRARRVGAERREAVTPRERCHHRESRRASGCVDGAGQQAHSFGPLPCPSLDRNDDQGRADIPEITRFYGIIIKLFFGDYPPPHFHAVYGESVGLFNIETLGMIEGDLPPRARKLVIEWAGSYRQDL
ncbi:DUF4160 domain-containing protein, partial [Thiohalocapsa sp. ML1]|uniref:DUF4160 domain-containing protein n=1 Tax=Thiohalocapsa sp. ML1 TaxID=1431688 RepID=UPI000A47EFBE